MQPQPPSLKPVIRRLVLVVVMFSFCSFALEVAVPDVHDGDASAEEVAQVTGSTLPDAGFGKVPQGQQPDGDSGHIHACHCSHAHGTLSSGVAEGDEQEPIVQAPIGITSLIPDAVDLEVQVRPPIA